MAAWKFRYWSPTAVWVDRCARGMLTVFRSRNGIRCTFWPRVKRRICMRAASADRNDPGYQEVDCGVIVDSDDGDLLGRREAG